MPLLTYICLDDVVPELANAHACEQVVDGEVLKDTDQRLLVETR